MSAAMEDIPAAAASADATVHTGGVKRSFDEMKEAAAPATDELATLLPAASAAPEWHAHAIRFGASLPAGSSTRTDFIELMKRIKQQTEAAGRPTANAVKAPILPPMQQPSITAAFSPVAPPPAEVVVAVQSAVAQPPASSAASSTPAAPAAAAPAVPAAASAPAAAATLPADVLLTIPDCSLLTPKGKFTLVLTPSQLLLTNPGAPAKNLAIQWKDVELLCDVPDLNKRDWLLVVQLKKDRSLLVGKKTQPAIVVKYLMTEKVKAARFIVASNAGAENAPALHKIQSFVASAGFVGSKFSAAVLSAMRLIPAMAQTTVVGAEPAIYDSLKKLPCVGCHHGVEDGALYFLRTGLLFVKPVIYIAIADINGIDPARGASSTFDMRVGIEGQKQQVEFKVSRCDQKIDCALQFVCASLLTLSPLVSGSLSLR
jgi:hypothetical protein